MPKTFTSSSAILLELLRNPNKIQSYSHHEWTLLLRIAKQSNLLAHIGFLIRTHQLESWVPEKIQNLIKSAQTIVNYRKRTALWELNRIRRALFQQDYQIVVLKGGAYLLENIPFSDSRLFSDIDILVKKNEIKSIEQILIDNSWRSMKLNEYDQKYYRQWMHEIPPLRHIRRAIEVDIHHTILPLTSRLSPNPDLLMGNAIDSGYYDYKTLSPTDMVLHSATHLFYDSDLGNRLKDLVDLDQLLIHFKNCDPEFINKLVRRSKQLELERPLYYALRYTNKILGTSIPEKLLQKTEGSPPYFVRILMDYLVPLAILPEHPDHPRKQVAFARWLLYIRSHYLRMPLKLLIPHLLYKSKVRWEENRSTA